jgi:prepilin-type N-terminal cleavage/methylation domain-containing protein
MSRSPVSDRPTAGFSLVEVMCAMAIAAISLVVLLRGVSGAQQAAGYLDTHLGARIVAQSIIADEMQALNSVPGRREGDSGIYHWQLRIEPAALTGIGQLPPAYRLYRLSVEINWLPRGSFHLDSLKLGR